MRRPRNCADFLRPQQPQLADLQEIIRDDPRLSADIYLHVFRSASRDLEENRVDQARAAFKTILTEAPQSVDSLYGLALCECQERNFKAADEYLKQVIAGQEDYAPAYNQLGVIAYLGNKYAEARKYSECQPY
jgi:tetratricopeptide (TPR) repeat protein